MQKSDGAFAGSGSTSTAGSCASEKSRKRKLSEITTLSDDDEVIKKGSESGSTSLSAGKRRKVSGHMNGTNGAKQIEVIVLD